MQESRQKASNGIRWLRWRVTYPAKKVIQFWNNWSLINKMPCSIQLHFVFFAALSSAEVQWSAIGRNRWAGWVQARETKACTCTHFFPSGLLPYVPKLLWSPVRSGEFRARLVLNIIQRIYYSIQNYRRVPKVAAPVTFGISRPEGPQLSGGRYFRVAVTFG